MHPGLEFEMDRPLPSFISGMHGSERDGQGSFAWTSGHVIAEIPGARPSGRLVVHAAFSRLASGQSARS
jgi:hypothetical protein